MRIKLAFVAITVTTLSVVGCQPSDYPRPVDTTPIERPCAAEDGPGPCTWYADQQGDGNGLSYTVDGQGRVTYWTPAQYDAYHGRG